MIKERTCYSYNDLTIIPATISDITSRSECNPYIENKYLPIFTAPMSTIVNVKNIGVWQDNSIIPIVPRNIDISERSKLLGKGQWVALSLDEFRTLFVVNVEMSPDESAYPKSIKGRTFNICIDIANGHMKYLYETINKAKELSRKHDYNLCIMTGNIANPKTYEWICKNAEVDYVRVSIGTGANCFVDGTKVTMCDGSQKNIEDVNIGDKVLTIDGSNQKVENTLRFKTNKKLVTINKEITSTEDHKFFVINKLDKDIVNEKNLEQYGYWIEANKLDKNLHLLIKKYR